MRAWKARTLPTWLYPLKTLAPIQGIEPRSVGPEPTVLPLNEIGVVGMVRFERTTSRSQGESSTSELHPDNYFTRNGWAGRLRTCKYPDPKSGGSANSLLPNTHTSSMAPRARFELAIYGLKGRHPWPLDERGTKLSNYLQKQEALRRDRRAQSLTYVTLPSHTSTLARFRTGRWCEYEGMLLLHDHKTLP
jgi:hypothetical protein